MGNRAKGYLGLNQQMWDLGGLSAWQLANQRYVGDKISELDASFDLIMVAEKMSESLVLLAHMLCIPLKAVAQIKKNSRKKKNRV